MEINCIGTIALVHNFLNAPKRQNILPSPSTRFCQQQKLKNLFKFVPPDGSMDTKV